VLFCFVYIASHSRLHLQPIPTRTTSVPSIPVQPICFLALTDSSARRLMPNDFALNDFRTLFTPTEGVPYSSLFLTSLPPCILFDKPISCNTYGSPRKCCKQKTCGLAKAWLKPLDATLTKKHGESPSNQTFLPSLALSFDISMFFSTRPCSSLPP
jgi:hypothetical protein